MNGPAPDAAGGSPARGIVVTHGRLGQAMIEAAEEISGISGELVAVSNRGVNPERLRERVREEVGEGPAVVFVDLAAGSCGFAGRAAVRDCAGGATVVTGVSLPMLLDFLFNRHLGLSALAERLVDRGRRNIEAIPPDTAPGTGSGSETDARPVQD